MRRRLLLRTAWAGKVHVYDPDTSKTLCGRADTFEFDFEGPPEGVSCKKCAQAITRKLDNEGGEATLEGAMRERENMTDMITASPDLLLDREYRHVYQMQESALSAYNHFVQSGKRNPDLFEALMKAAHQATIMVVHEVIKRRGHKAVGVKIDTIDGALYIAEVDHPQGLDIEVTMTSDSFPVNRTEMASQEEDLGMPPVMYEAWIIDASGKLVSRYHGWANSGDRKVFQVG